MFHIWVETVLVTPHQHLICATNINRLQSLSRLDNVQCPVSVGSVPNIHVVKSALIIRWQYWCWWRMLETKCVGDNFKMLVTVFTVVVTNILYLLTLASGTNIEILSQTFKNCHQDKVTNIYVALSDCSQANDLR